jgi:chromosome segregation ATPase
MNTSVLQQKSSFQYRYEDMEKENRKLRQQIGDLNTKIQELNKVNSNLDLKFKDCLREMEMSKITTIGGVITAKESLENEELKNKVDNKDNEILEIKIKYDREIEKQNNEIYRLKESIDKLNYDLLEYRQMKKEYEDLKIKVKELAKYKELCADYNDLLSTIDARNRQLEAVNTEKRGYVTQIERLQKEIIVEKDRYRQLEYEKKKLEYDFNDMRADVSKMEIQIKRKDTCVIN